jgi:NADPH oxidase
MSLGTLLKKQLTPTKLLFHFLFWTFHWGIFAYGWYALPGCRLWWESVA